MQIFVHYTDEEYDEAYRVIELLVAHDYEPVYGVPVKKFED